MKTLYQMKIISIYANIFFIECKYFYRMQIYFYRMKITFIEFCYISATIQVRMADYRRTYPLIVCVVI